MMLQIQICDESHILEMQLLVMMPSPWRFVRFKCSLSRFTRNCCKHSCIQCIKSPMKYTLLASDTKYVAWMTPQRAINIWHIEISIRPDNLNFTSYLVSILKSCLTDINLEMLPHLLTIWKCSTYSRISSYSFRNYRMYLG